jgi:hypothetical protein
MSIVSVLETLPESVGTVAVIVTVEGPGGVGRAGEFGDVAEETGIDAGVLEEPPQLSNPVAAITRRASIADTCIFRKRTLSLVAVRSPSAATEINTER